MTTKEAWLKIAKEFDKPKGPHKFCGLGLCAAINDLYNEKEITLEQWAQMKERIDKELKGIYFLIHQNGSGYYREDRPKRAAVARKFAEECE